MKVRAPLLPLVVLLVGCSPPAREPDRPRPGPRAAPAAEASLTEVNRVYRIASRLRAQADGKPQAVAVPGGRRAWTVVLQQTQWRLKQVPQSANLGLRLRTRYLKLPEAERRQYMDRLDDHLQLWWVEPTGAGTPGAELKGALTPTTRSHRLHREVAFLGRDERVAWFAYAPIPEWIKLQRSMALKGGDGAVDAMIRGLTIKDPHESTALGCYYLLAEVGLAAKDAVAKLIASKHPARGRAVAAVGRGQGEAVTRWLMPLVESPDSVVAFEARRRVLYPPRKEAAALYLKWLAEGAGKREVWRELRACSMLELRGAAPILPKVLASPQTIAEYRQAFLLQRKLKGKPLPADLLKTRQRMIRAGFANGDKKPDRDELSYGVSRIARSRDYAAAAMIGLGLALFVSKGNYDATRAAGVRILQKIRGRRGRKLVRHLARACRDSGDRDTLKQLLKKVR